MEISKILIDIDYKMDFYPFVSIVNNLINIIEKICLDAIACVAACFSISREGLIGDNLYLIHLDKKTYKQCFGLLIPFLNIGIADRLSLRRENYTENQVGGINESKEKFSQMSYVIDYIEFCTKLDTNCQNLEDGELPTLSLEELELWQSLCDKMRENVLKQNTKPANALLKCLDNLIPSISTLHRVSKFDDANPDKRADEMIIWEELLPLPKESCRLIMALDPIDV